ncbi:MAG: signal peptide peptidase SppA [Microcoleaceae cyanobacterium]
MKDFFKYTFASLVGNLLGLVLIMTMGIGGLVFLAVSTASKDTGPKVKDKSVLVFDLSLNITDADPEYSTGQLLEQAVAESIPNQIQLRTLLESIEEASEDDRIVALYLKGGNSASGNGLATLKEVREALEQFKESGKPIIAYDIDWTEQEYYLSSVADTVVIHPLGSLEMNGLSAQVTFLTGALEKFGVGVQVTRVGKYKSGVEPFLRKDLSPENREQTQQLLSDIWGEYVRSISPSRDLTPAQIGQIVNNQGILMAEVAQQQNLVDQVAYFDEIVADFKELTEESEEEDKLFRQISIKSYANTSEVVKASQGDIKSDNQIAIVYAEGTIVEGQGVSGQIGGDRMAKQLRKIRFNEDVKAVVLRVNSPGGSATASEIISREIELIQAQEKPVIVSMGNLAASGGYWIAADADKIFAEPNTITGSIGVFGLLFNVQEIGNENGITWDSVKTGKFADLTTAVRPKTPEELAQIQKMVDLIYQRFITKVAESRDLPKSKVQEIAQGRVWSGLDAQEIGLVDELGGIEDAIQAAAEVAELGKDWKLVEYPKSRTLEERIFENLSGTKVTESLPKPDPLTQEFLKLQKELTALQAMNDSRGIYTRLPFNFHID